MVGEGAKKVPKPGDRQGLLTVLAGVGRGTLLCLCAGCGKPCHIYGAEWRKGCAGCPACRRHNHDLSGTVEHYRWRRLRGEARQGLAAVFAPWLTSFQRFLADVGLRPSPRHRLVRPNPDAPYAPGNALWQIPQAADEQAPEDPAPTPTPGGLHVVK